MQPCSREMQAIAASLSGIGIQTLLGGATACGGDEFLEQMLAAAPSAAWCDHMAEDPAAAAAAAAAEVVVVPRYAPYDPIGGGGAASSAAALGILLAPAIGDGGGEIDAPSSFKSLDPTGGEGAYDGGFESVNELRNRTCERDNGDDGDCGGSVAATAEAASEGEERPSNGSPQHR